MQMTRMPCICTWVHTNAGTQQSPHPHPLSLHFHKARLYLAGCLVVITPRKYRGRVQRSTAILFELKPCPCLQVKVAMLELDVGSNILLRRHSNVWR
jgi:hypothetical protein